MAAFAAVVAVLVGAVAPAASIPAALVGALLYMQFDFFVRRRRATAPPPAAGAEGARPSPAKRVPGPPSKRVTPSGSKPVHRRKKRS
jgi:hypothetical protein